MLRSSSRFVALILIPAMLKQSIASIQIPGSSLQDSGLYALESGTGALSNRRSILYASEALVLPEQQFDQPVIPDKQFRHQENSEWRLTLPGTRGMQFAPYIPIIAGASKDKGSRETATWSALRQSNPIEWLRKAPEIELHAFFSADPRPLYRSPAPDLILELRSRGSFSSWRELEGLAGDYYKSHSMLINLKNIRRKLGIQNDFTKLNP